MFPRIRKGFSLLGLTGMKVLKKVEAVEKNIPGPKAELVCMCVREKATIFLKVYKKCKSPIQKGF